MSPLGCTGVPNGVDKNFRRLLMAATAYRQKYGEWPTQARMAPWFLHNLAYLFESDEFERIALHLELRTKTTGALSVGGTRGYLSYDDVDVDRLEEDVLEQTEKWLNVEIRRDIEHW